MRLLPRFNHDWKRLFVELPHVRYDGLYILETIYWRPGGYGLEQHQKILKITYYRVLRFFPGNKVLYALINGSCDSAAVDFSNEASQIVKHGHYKMSTRGVDLIVDCGHLTAKMVLSFDDCGVGNSAMPLRNKSVCFCFVCLFPIRFFSDSFLTIN